MQKLEVSKINFETKIVFFSSFRQNETYHLSMEITRITCALPPLGKVGELAFFSDLKSYAGGYAFSQHVMQDRVLGTDKEQVKGHSQRSRKPEIMLTVRPSYFPNEICFSNEIHQ